MGTTKSCDICGGTEGTEGYNLRRYNPRSPEEKARRALSHNPSNQYQGRFSMAGAIDLCAACWERIAKPRMRPQNSPKSIKNQYMKRRIPNPNYPWRERTSAYRDD
jgi:hypothetical protein